MCDNCRDKCLDEHAIIIVEIRKVLLLLSYLALKEINIKKANKDNSPILHIINDSFKEWKLLNDEY